MNARLAGVALLTLSACAAGYEMADTGVRWTSYTEGTTAPLELRVDVFPSVTGTKDDGYRALPQTTGPFLIPTGDLDIGEVNLRRPLLVGGTIVGTQVRPSPMSGAALPGTSAPVPGTVHLVREGSVQQYGTRSDDAGTFQLSAVPQDTYVFEFIPDDPQFPAYAQDLALTDTAPEVAIDVGYGMTLHGRVLSDDGAPMPDARIHAVTLYGTRTGEVTTDDQGYYELRVSEGIYDVVCEGRGFPSVDPTIAEEAVEVFGTGKRVDFSYLALNDILAEGQVMTEGGDPLGGVTVRFTSQELEGYEDTLATASFEAQTDADGVFARRVLPGLYTIEYLPESPLHSPSLIESVVLEASGAQLAPMTIEGLGTLDGYVLDPFGDAVPRTQISCVEEGFSHRRFVSQADDQGLYTLKAPRVPLGCTLTPPGDRTDLPMTPLNFDLSGPIDAALVFAKGLLVSGSIALDGEPEPSALVELTTSSGTRLGASLTDSEGAFRLVIARQE